MTDRAFGIGDSRRSRWLLPRGLLRFARTVGLLVCLSAASASAAEPESEKERHLQPSDFAVGRGLTNQAPGVLQSVLLDYDVYRWSVEPGLADLRVFDDAGQPVPYALRKPEPRRHVESAKRSLPIFRLERNSNTALDPRDPKALDGDYRIDAELSDSGAIVRIYRDSVGEVSSAASPASEARGDAAGWLLDASAVRGSMRRLDFEVSAPEGDYVTLLRIESSNDLARWKDVEANAALVHLVRGSHRIERNRFDLQSVSARYLRVTLVDPVPGLELRNVHARLADRRRSVERFPNRRRVVSGRYDAADSAHVLFDIGARLPIESVRLQLSEKNSIIEGQLESAPTAKGPWTVRQSGLFYSIEKGVTLRNARVAHRSSSDRYFRFRSSARGGGLGDALPTLEVEWRPQQLMYVQRRPGAMQLAVGRSGTRDGAFGADALLGISGRRRSDFPDASANLGPEFVLAGDAALRRLDPIVPKPWRTYGLWALLLISVGVVLALTLRLMRNIEAENEDPPAPTDSV